MTAPGPAKRQSAAGRAISTTTIVAARAMRKTGQHPVAEGFFGLLGLAILGADGFFLFRHPPAGTPDLIGHGVVAVLGLAVIPGAGVRAGNGLSSMAAGVGKFASAVAEAWKKKQ